MGVKSKYKQSEVGLIPHDWTVDALAQIAPLQRGFDLPRSQRKDGPFPVVYSNGIENFHVKAMVQGPGVVTGRSGTLGPVHYVDGDYWPHNTTLWVTRFCKNSPRFIYHLYTYIGFERFGSGSGVPTLNRNDAHAYRVAIPKDEGEQEAIAEALSDADILIESLEQLLAKKRLIKQATMQELLTGNRRLQGFSGKWQSKPLKEILEVPVTDGPHLTPEFLDQGIPFLSVNNLVDGKIDWSNLRYISEADHKEFSRKCWPRYGDILLGKAASVGKVAIVDSDIEFNIWSPIALIRVGSGCSAKFVYYQLQSKNLEKQIMLLTNASSQGNIGMGDIEKLVLPTPCDKEQVAIAEVLSNIDAELSVLDIKLSKARQLKQGMMQELLTGRIRLV